MQNYYIYLFICPVKTSHGDFITENSLFYTLTGLDTVHCPGHYDITALHKYVHMCIARVKAKHKETILMSVLLCGNGV